MARSVYIWVVSDRCGPVAAFTVKHELKTWFSRQPVGCELTCLKVQDNPSTYGYGCEPKVVEIDLEKL